MQHIGSQSRTTNSFPAAIAAAAFGSQVGANAIDAMKTRNTPLL
tara:strand:- start:2336 stop:2467 length:132 start_codon:yes stop_codon:yes gene_type:complete